jgi:HEAT repeat protein
VKEHETTCLSPVISLYFENLSSPLPEIRKSALALLSQYADDPEVKKEIAPYLDKESDEECKKLLFLFSKDSAKENINLKSENSKLTMHEFYEFFKNTSILKAKTELPKLKTFAIQEQMEFVKLVMSSDLIAEKKVLILKQPDFLLKNEEVKEKLVRLLVDSNSLLSFLAFSVLSRIDSGLLLKKLPTLLKNDKLHIKINAIRVLFKISEHESIRLLEQFVFNSNQDIYQRNIAFSAMFLFPFNKIRHLILKVLKEEDISLNIFKLIGNLVKNNPDPLFLEQLILITIIKGDKSGKLVQLCQVAAKSLILAELESGTPKEIVKKYWLKCKSNQQKEKLIAVGNNEIFLDEEKPKTQTVTNSFLTFNELIEKKIEKENKNWLSAIQQLTSEDVSNKKIVSKLEELLDSENNKITLSAINFLRKNNKSLLLKHLPVLVLNDDPFIFSQATRYYVKLEKPERLIYWINKWLKTKNEKKINLAFSCLLQMKFDDIKDLILKLLKNEKDKNIIEKACQIISLNPEINFLRTIKMIQQATSNKSKKEILASHIAQIEKNLSLVGDKSSNKSRNNQAVIEILQEIKEIHYFSSFDYFELINKFKFPAILIILVIIMGAFTFFSESDPVVNYPNKQIQTKVKIASPSPPLEQGQSYLFILKKFNYLNDSWDAVLKSKPQNKYRILMGKTAYQLSPGKTIKFTVKNFTVTPLGTMLVTPFKSK